MHVYIKTKGHHKKYLLSLLILLTLFFLTPPSAISQTEAVGEVVRFVGIARVEREGRSWQVQVEEPIHLHDRLQTGAESRIEIVFLDNSRVRIAPNSTLEITEYLYQPEQKKRQSLLSIWSGKARFLVNDLVHFRQRDFVVHTQNAIVGTRGTDYIVTTMKKNPWVTEVSVLEGIVELCNRLEEKLRVECVELTRLMVAQVLDVSSPSETREIETVPELEETLEGVVWPEEPDAETIMEPDPFTPPPPTVDLPEDPSDDPGEAIQEDVFDEPVSGSQPPPGQ